jgi:hypothetical protein
MNLTAMAQQLNRHFATRSRRIAHCFYHLLGISGMQLMPFGYHLTDCTRSKGCQDRFSCKYLTRHRRDLSKVREDFRALEVKAITHLAQS